VSDGPLPFDRGGSGPALVLLHGFTGSARSMAALARPLEREFETILPDLPGHGRAPPPDAAGAAGFESCLRALIATLRSAGHERAHWLGYSMGARLALACAVRHPERVVTLTLIGGRAGIADPVERERRRTADDALAGRIETRGLEAFVAEWMAQPLFATQRRLGPEFLERVRRERMRHDPRGLATALRALGPGVQPPLFEDLARVTVPVLLVAGALDPAFVAHARDLARRLPHAEIREVPGAGHAVHLEQPAAAVAAVRKFLGRAGGLPGDVALHSVQETGS
jgi:2-succinyl-6-hydroxy-2,4-cyclohexadiene-1-carboxylate synthase